MGNMPLPLDRIGQRFSIRLHDPEGGYRDVVGHLKTATSLVNRKGQEISFDPEQIFIWREIVERPTLAGKGANFDENLKVAQEFYRKRNLPTIFQLAHPTWQALSEKLFSIGAVEALRGNTMVADLTSHRQEIPIGFELRQSDQFSNDWMELPPKPGLEKILSGCAATYFTIAQNEKTIATCRIALALGWSSITRVYVDQDFRGQGLGKAIVAAALEGSLEQGATKAVLQVEANNATAIGVYESLGFNFHHEYSYLEMK